MPPKKSASSKPAKAKATAVPGAIAIPDLTAIGKSKTQKVKNVVPNPSNSSHESTSTKKRRAETPTGNETAPKKTKKVATPLEVVEISSDESEAEVAPVKRKADTSVLPEDKKKQLDELKFTLSDHVPRSMAAIMEAISYQGAPLPDTIPELVEIVICELTDRVMAGKDIETEMAAIAKIDQAHWDGEYDDDPDGFPKDVRKRLNNVENMVSRMTSMYLKDILKELTYFGARGGTNRDMAAMVVAILHQKALDGESLKREYRTIKLHYGGCYGGCADDSGLGEGSEDEEYNEDDF